MADSQSSFYSILFRQKYIKRWGLMNSVTPENLCEHSAETAILAHALAVIGNTYFGKDYDCGRTAELSLFHDSAEVYTGDLPTPIKYYSPEMRKSYAKIESNALNALIEKLPPEMRTAYSETLFNTKESDAELWILVKAADKLAAHIKALTEVRAGNGEFIQAQRTTREAMDKMDCPELMYFREHFLDAFGLTLDEMQMNYTP